MAIVASIKEQLRRKAASALTQALQPMRLRTHAIPKNISSLRLFSVSSQNSSSIAPNSGAEGATTAAAEGLEAHVAKSGTQNPAPPQSSRSIRGGPVSWLSLALLICTGAGLLQYYDGEKRKRIEAIRDGPAAPTAGPSVGVAAIGGPFKLLNQEGKEVTDRDFVGNWTVVYFGFTFCPDICPVELTKLAKAVDNVEKKIGLKIVPLFISVDPERDTVQQVRDYLKDYHPRFVGLTGSVQDIRHVARQYRVYYMKTDEDGDNYLVDHSIIFYLMNPDMEFVKFYGKNYDADALTAGIVEEIQKVSNR